MSALRDLPPSRPSQIRTFGLAVTAEIIMLWSLLAGLVVSSPVLLGEPCHPSGPPCTTPFGGVGTLVVEEECVLFAAESGAFYQIANAGPFGDGDLVWVSGTLQAFCPALCLKITSGCILDNIIGKPFQGCGALQVGPQGCTVFVADGGQGFFLENEGSFQIGDRVYVEGCVDENSPFCQPLTVVGLQDNTIEPCFEVCGIIQSGPQGCTIISTREGVFVPDTTGGFSMGDCICVAGQLVLESFGCFPANLPAIENNSVAACPGFTPFTGCGELAPGPQGCLWFNADSGGSFFLEDIGRFGTGDRVYVEGTLIPDFSCFPPVGPGIVDNTIEKCFDLCGTLGPGPQSCTLVVGKDGQGFAVDNPGGFEFGDLVFVSGKLVRNSFACFPAQIPAIENNSIAECFSGCGTLVIPILCPVALAADDGSGIYALENLGDFGPNDVVFVEGAIDPDCKDGGTCTCIDNNIITRCPGGPDADLNDDGTVNGADLGLLLAAFGNCPNCELIACDADLNGDCTVDGADIGLLLAAFR